ncbi:MAG: hypothetical protein R3263_07875, partial [Myxococcota bacterium]|nr:hypothetical protein [Myxococcota bacterium]
GARKRDRSAFLRERHARTNQELRAAQRRWFPELVHAPAEVAEAVELVTSFEAWDRLRTDQRLGRARARAAMELALRALLASAGA